MSDTGTSTEGAEAPKQEASDNEVEKWKALARKHEARAKENAKAAERLAEMEDASKSEGERLAERIAAAEKRASDAESKALRYEVAAAKGVPAKLLKFLSGATEEDLNASADELLAAVTPDTGASNETPAPPARPQERLVPGAANDAEPEEMDPAKLAESIPRL